MTDRDKTAREIAEQLVPDGLDANLPLRLALRSIAEQAALLAYNKGRADMREAVLAAASRASEPEYCDNIGPMDPETGYQECSLEIRGDPCPCAGQQAMADKVLAAIRAIPVEEG